MKNKLKISIDKSFMQYTKGSIITVNANKGIPVDKFWRDRLKDSEIDGCVSVVKKTRKPSVKKSNQEIDNDNAS